MSNIDLDKFRETMATGELVEGEMLKTFHTLSQEALKITMELNNKYHSEEEIVELFSQLTGREVDKSFRLFPPFYTDCGKNIKKIFIQNP